MSGSQRPTPLLAEIFIAFILCGAQQYGISDPVVK